MRHTVIYSTRLFAALLCTACVHTGTRPEPVETAADITPQDLRTRLFRITDDSTMGRESGSKGAYVATAYIASEFSRLGLEPGGDNGTWFQEVPLWTVAADPSSRLSAGGNALTVFRDFLPGTSVAPPVSFAAAELVYAGHIGDTAQLIASADAKGRVVLLGVPAGMSYRGANALAARYSEARAMFIAALDDVPAEIVARLRDGRPVADTSRNARALPIVYVTRTAVGTLLGTTAALPAPGTLGKPLSGQVNFLRTPVAFPARNVVGIWRGSDPVLQHQYVSLTAHNDHVGFDSSPVDHDSLRAFNTVVRPMGADSPVREPTATEWARIKSLLAELRKKNAPRLDSIRNGADDDGSGTASLLEIAEKLSGAAERPRRSILFVSHTGEEAGLLGSRWFSDHATVPIDSIVGEIDQDMIGRGTATDFPRGGTGAGSDTYLEVIGAKRISKAFGEYLEQANASQPTPFVFDYTYDTPGHPLQYYCRADHYSYARYGIPSVAISRGEHQDYHQVTDEAQYISYPDLARVSRLVYSAALLIANAPTRPKTDVPKPANPNLPCRQ
jgi:hypothetical protein